MLYHRDDDRTPPASGSGKEKTPGDSQEEPANHGTLIVDATCAPPNIRFPQDISLLNEASFLSLHGSSRHPKNLLMIGGRL